MRNLLKNIILVILITGPFGCSSPKVTYNYPTNSDVTRKSQSGKFMSLSWLPFGDKKDEENDQSKQKSQSKELRLWEASVAVIGGMFPISVMDERSGLIATEWYQEKPDSKIRIKVNLLLKEGDDKNPTIRVSIFQQERLDGNSPWQGSGLHSSESVASSSLKAKKIKNEILKRAKLNKGNI